LDTVAAEAARQTCDGSRRRRPFRRRRCGGGPRPESGPTTIADPRPREAQTVTTSGEPTDPAGISAA
jgi:hypothetical protein